MNPNRRVVIFDMDGTLTRPGLDFDRMRRETGIAGPILEGLRDLPPADRARAEAVLERHEAQAAATSELQPEAAQVVAAVRAAGLPAVLMTRNSPRSVEAFEARHGLRFDMVWTRENGAMKPSPAPILAICRALKADPRAAWTIGDFHYDIVCGAAAGATTVLLLDERAERPAWANEADYVIHRLGELLPLLGIAPR